MTVKLFAHAEREDGYARAALEDHIASIRLLTADDASMTVILFAERSSHRRNDRTGAVAVEPGQHHARARSRWRRRWSSASTNVRLDHARTRDQHLREYRRRPGRHGDDLAGPTRSSNAPDAQPLVCRMARSAMRRSTSITAARAGPIDAIEGCRWPSGRARRSGWSAGRGRASRPWSTCCCASTISESGRILIDGQDIAGVTQDSLRAQIGMVTQDTSLLHRSVRTISSTAGRSGDRGGDRRPRNAPMRMSSSGA